MPALVLARLTWPKINRGDKAAYGLTSLVLVCLTFPMEIVYRRFKIWVFSEDVDPLLGLRFLGEPVEEFSFWAGATPFMLLVYLLARSFLSREEENDGL